MKSRIIIAVMALFPVLAYAQSATKPAKCKLEINGVDSFTGKVKKTTAWFNITAESQPVIQAQLIHEGEYYFLNLALNPQQFNLNIQQGYCRPYSHDGDVLQAQLTNGDLLSFDLMAKHALNSTLIVSSYSVNYYSSVYAVSKEQLAQLATGNIIKLRVYHDNGYYYDLSSIDNTSRDNIKDNATCILQ